MAKWTPSTRGGGDLEFGPEHESHNHLEMLVYLRAWHLVTSDSHARAAAAAVGDSDGGGHGEAAQHRGGGDGWPGLVLQKVQSEGS